MPQTAAGFIAKKLAFTFLNVVAAAGGGSLALGSATLALTAFGARRARELRNSQDFDRATGRQIVIRSTEAPRNIVYGQAAVGGVVTYQNATGDENRLMYTEIVHTGHEVDSFVSWRFDTREVLIADVDDITPVNIRTSAYQWTASGSGTNEYYLELSGGGDPGISQPTVVTENGSDMTAGTAGSLAAGEWDWADNDTLGFPTVYVRLTDNTDPDTKASGYLWRLGNGAVNADTNSHDYGPADGTTIMYLRAWPGLSDQPADNDLVATFTDITSTHRHRGCAKTVMRFDLLVGSEDRWDGGAPQAIQAVLKGKKVYDPRLDSTFSGDWGTGSGPHRLSDSSTWAWSENPALIWADYRIDSTLGPGWDSTRIDYNSVAEAADDCDALVLIPPASPTTQEKRFTCNCVLTTQMTPEECIEIILSSMKGREIDFGGTWHVYAGMFESSSFTLNEDSIIGPVDYRDQPLPSDRYNAVKGMYYDPSRDHKISPFLEVTDSTTKTNRDNGRDLYKEIRLQATNGEFMAQRIAYRLLRQNTNSGILVCRVGYEGADRRIGDVGSVTISELNFSSKLFRVVDIKHIQFVGFELTLKEESSAAYTDPTVGEYGTRTAAGVITFPRLRPSASRFDGWVEIGGNLVTDPQFSRQVGMWDGTGGANGDHFGYFWQENTANSGVTSISRTGGVFGGVLVLDCPSGATDLAEAYSIPRESNLAITGETIRLTARVRKTTNNTLGVGAALDVPGLMVANQSWAAGDSSIQITGISLNETDINGWTVNQWQEYHANITVTNQIKSSPQHPWFLVGLSLTGCDADTTIEVDSVSAHRVAP